MQIWEKFDRSKNAVFAKVEKYIMDALNWSGSNNLLNDYPEVQGTANRKLNFQSSFYY